MSLSRRSLLRAAPLGLAAVSVPTFAATALAAPSAPAEASDEWTKAFLNRAENREFFTLDDMDDWQTQNARFVIAVCKGHGISAHGTQIVLATAIVEAWLYNYEPAVDLDSGGMFQQRPSMGWGTAPTTRAGMWAAPRRPCRPAPSPSATRSRPRPPRRSGTATSPRSIRTPTDAPAAAGRCSPPPRAR